MTVLMVTPYPPYRDGIGAYAVQEVRRMRSEGVDVEVLSPVPSAAHHHLALGTLRGVLALAKKARHYETTVIQFSPEMLFGSCRGPLERVAVWGGLEALARVTKLEIRQHEIEWGPLKRNPAERLAAARALRAAEMVSVHTQGEVDRLTGALAIDPGVITLVEHGRHFVQATAETQAEARAELGLHASRHLFLSIGFLQEHKGFDRAAEAFRAAGLAGQAELHIVGSVRVNHPDLVAHANALHRLARTIPGVEVHQRYVSDEEFDRWILASDTVVLPYREIWSSSVLERAKLLARPIVAADVGGLGDQAPSGTMFFDDAESLAQCLKERAATTASRPESDEADASGIAADYGTGSEWQVQSEHPDRQGIEAQIRNRARVARGAEAGVAASEAAEPLLALETFRRPEPNSTRRGVTELKRTIRRLVNWELEPLALQVDKLQQASTDALARLDAAMVANGGVGADPGRSRVEEPFVHQAMRDIPPGARVLLVGGAGSPLAAALVASGYVVTVLDPTDVIAAAAARSAGDIGGNNNVVVSLSAANRSGDADDGVDEAWIDALTTFLAPKGRLVVSAVSPTGDEVTLPAALRPSLARIADQTADGSWAVTIGPPRDDDGSSADPAGRLLLLAADLS